MYIRKLQNQSMYFEYVHFIVHNIVAVTIAVNKIKLNLNDIENTKRLPHD